VTLVPYVRDLRICFDADVSMRTHVSKDYFYCPVASWRYVKSEASNVQWADP